MPSNKRITTLVVLIVVLISLMLIVLRLVSDPEEKPFDQTFVVVEDESLLRVDDEFPNCAALASRDISECSSYYYDIPPTESQEQMQKRCEFESAQILSLHDSDKSYCRSIMDGNLRNLCIAVNDKRCDTISSFKELCESLVDLDVESCGDYNKKEIDCEHIISIVRDAKEGDCIQEHKYIYNKCKALKDRNKEFCTLVE